MRHTASGLPHALSGRQTWGTWAARRPPISHGYHRPSPTFTPRVVRPVRSWLSIHFGRLEKRRTPAFAKLFLSSATLRNTGTSWGTRLILNDLYNHAEPVDSSNWQRLDAMIRERADDRSWQRDIMRQTHIKRYCAEYARREGGQDSDVLQYALEWAFFTRCQWGEFDTALYELERCWGKTPESPAPIGGGARPSTEQVVQNLEDVQRAIEHYVRQIATVEQERSSTFRQERKVQRSAAYFAFNQIRSTIEFHK
jgi:hypothetical protein